MIKNIPIDLVCPLLPATETLPTFMSFLFFSALYLFRFACTIMIWGGGGIYLKKDIPVTRPLKDMTSPPPATIEGLQLLKKG